MAYDRFGADRTGNKKQGMTAAQKSNQSRSNNYKLNDYSADFRFGQQGQNYGNKTKRGGFNLPFGGGGGGNASAFAQMDLDYQNELDKRVWERSTPDVTGVGGSVSWDRDKNMLTTSLSDENQSIYDAMFARQKRFADEADALGAGGVDAMTQRRFDQKRALYAESDALTEARRREQEQNTGASTTAKYYGQRAGEDAISQRNMQLEDSAFLEAQGLYTGAMDRQRQDIASMGSLGAIANNMKVMPTPNTQANMLGVSDASTAMYDLQAMEAAKKSKGKSDAWGSILGSIFG
tara:strand:+ start:210 stop:1085 length:876 start_codon:yes stop_codon:yes gene_type:complete